MLTSFFPSRRLTIYLAKGLLIRIIAILIILTAVLQVLDLLGETGHVLAYPGNGNSALWKYVLLRLPQLVATFLPFSVLLGTLATFFVLNQNSEIISMKAAGLSAHQILAPTIMAGLIIAIVSFAFNERVVTRASAELYRWEQAGYGPIPPAPNGQEDVWAKAGNGLIHVDAAVGRGNDTRLHGVTIYMYDQSAGPLAGIVSGAIAIPQNGGWVLQNAQRFDVASGHVTPIGNMVFAQDVRPDRFTLASVNADRMPIDQLGAAIVDLRAAGRPTDALVSGWWHKISKPLSALLMPLLGSVAAFGLARSGKLFVRAVIGMALGFAYFVADNAALAMGNIGVYPPLLAAWGPFLLFLLIGETMLVRTEE